MHAASSRALITISLTGSAADSSSTGLLAVVASCDSGEHGWFRVFAQRTRGHCGIHQPLDASLVCNRRARRFSSTCIVRFFHGDCAFPTCQLSLSLSLSPYQRALDAELLMCSFVSPISG